MIHAFETEIAADVGIPAAIILHSIALWCEKNERDGRNYHDGRYWTFDTLADIAVKFPYVSYRTTRRAIAELVEKGYLLTGNYNKATFDRTCWYAPSDKTLAFYPTGIMDNSNVQYGQMKYVQNGQANTKLDPNTNIPPIIPPEEPPKPKAKSKPPVDLAQFDVFWTAYPKKVDKQDTVKVWEKLNPNAELFEKIMSGLNRSVAYDHRFRERQFTPSPARWLRGKSWEDEFELPKPPPQQASSPAPKPKKDLVSQMREIVPAVGAPPPPEVEAMIEEWKRTHKWR